MLQRDVQFGVRASGFRSRDDGKARLDPAGFLASKRVSGTCETLQVNMCLRITRCLQQVFCGRGSFAAATTQNELGMVGECGANHVDEVGIGVQPRQGAELVWDVESARDMTRREFLGRANIQINPPARATLREQGCHVRVRE